MVREDEIKLAMANLEKGVTVVHGNCRGVDTIAEKWCRAYGISTIKMTPQWKLYSRWAANKRNDQMVNMQPDILIAFHPIGKCTPGTLDAINKAKKKAIKVQLVCVQQPYTGK